jgi:hypothetical protein
MTDQQTTSSPQIMPPTDGAAETAYNKATRPRFKKKRVALPSAASLLFLIIMIITGGNDPGIFDLSRAPWSHT